MHYKNQQDGRYNALIFIAGTFILSSSLRVALFNVAMSHATAGKILEQTASPATERFKKIAATIQHVRPDILLLCEFDHHGDGGDDGALDNFCRHYLAVAQQSHSGEKTAPIDYPYRYLPPSNSGLLSEIDFNGDNQCTLPEDGYGFGDHHGHYGFVILSRYPIDESQLRSWQCFLWRDMPNNQMPRGYYSAEAQKVFRLSSKSHIALPVIVGDRTLQLLCCHPTPPVFDGEEKRNLRRNHDELRLLVDIIDNADYLYDDKGVQAGLASTDSFIVMGDLNADPVDGDGSKSAIKQLLHHVRINRSVSCGRQTPKSLGGRFARIWQPRVGRASEWTHLSGLRLDYVLPSHDLKVLKSGVFWPDRKDPMRPLMVDEKGRERAQAGSDHRMVWVDIKI